MVDTPQVKTGAEDVVWDLSVFYAGIDDPAIDADMQAAQQEAAAFAETYRGKVATLDGPAMAEAMQRMETLYDKVVRIYSFASLTHASDTNNPQYGALVQKVTEFYAALQQQLLFFTLEWKAAPDDHIQAVLASDAVAKYRHGLESELRYKPYTLTEAEERVLVEKSVTGNNAWTRFFSELTSAMRYEYDGEMLTQSEVLTKLYSSDRDERRKANESVTKGLRDKAMELTYIFNVLAADKASNDRMRGYESWVKSRNLSNEAPDEVVEALIQTVTSNYELVMRHYRLKRALLGLDELREYDRYAPLPLESGDKFYTWGQAQEIVLQAFGTFSEDMAAIAGRFFDENWIHAPAVPGKRGGAFSASTTPSAHPFVLMNYTGKPRDVSTLAHELGHGVHQYLAGQKQGLFGAETPLTTAEMASVFGETLVFNDLLSREDDPQARLAMIFEKIEDSFATVFRQVSMNRFEDAMHTARREEGELSTERLSELWMQTQRDMFGDSVNLSDDYGLWWSYIPHFLHVPGYVYAYAFGELLVLALYEIYKEKGPEFVPQYIEVLAWGGNDKPENILATVGVDLNDPAFWQKGIDVLATLIDEEEKLARELSPDKF